MLGRIGKSPQYARRKRPTSRGAVQIEFVLSFLVIMFLIFGMWELIMIVHTMNVLSDAAKEGVRCAEVRGVWNPSTKSCDAAGNPVSNPPPCPSGIESVVREYARFTLHDTSAMNVSVTYPTDGRCNVSGHLVRVQVSYTFVPYTALKLKPTLSAVAEGRLVN